MIEIGDVIRFCYPTTNVVELSLADYRHWTIEVTAIRDLRQHPLLPATIAAKPLVGRSRWLISGECLYTGRERSFYSGSMLDCESHTVLTLGGYDPITSALDFTYGEYPPTARHRRLLARVCDRVADFDDVAHVARILPMEQRTACD